MSYLVDLDNNEIEILLRNGSTNQRNFVKNIYDSGNNFDDVINSIYFYDKMNGVKTDLRGYLNGGVLTFEKITEEIGEKYYYIECRNGYGIVYM